MGRQEELLSVCCAFVRESERKKERERRENECDAVFCGGEGEGVYCSALTHWAAMTSHMCAGDRLNTNLGSPLPTDTPTTPLVGSWHHRASCLLHTRAVIRNYLCWTTRHCHVTHINVSRHTYQCHVTHIKSNKALSCHTYSCVMSHIPMPCHTYQVQQGTVMLHIFMCHVTHTNAMSHISSPTRHCHVTHVNVSCHTYQCHVTHIKSNKALSCHTY